MSQRLLLTRPAGRNDALAAKLSAAGIAVEVLPLLSIAALDSPPIADDYTPVALIAVSVPALEHGLAALPARYQKLPCYAVGAATAAYWRDAGFGSVSSPDLESSEGLLTLLDTIDLSARPVLMLRGEGGRTTLAEGLRARGALLSERVVYRRVRPEPERCAQIQHWFNNVPATGSALRRSAVLLSSVEALEMLCAIIAPAQRQGVHALCLGARISALAQNQFGRVSLLTELSAAAIAGALPN